MKLLHLGGLFTPVSMPYTCPVSSLLGRSCRRVLRSLDTGRQSHVTMMMLQTPWRGCALCRLLASGNPASGMATKSLGRTVRETTCQTAPACRRCITVRCCSVSDSQLARGSLKRQHVAVTQCCRRQRRSTFWSCRVWHSTPEAGGWGAAAATMTTLSAAAWRMHSHTAVLRRSSVGVLAWWLVVCAMHPQCFHMPIMLRSSTDVSAGCSGPGLQGADCGQRADDGT